MHHSNDDTAQEGGTDYRMAEFAIKGLHVLDATVGDIIIKMNNVGGDEYHGLAIFDAIRRCTNAVTIVGFGCIMSMGAWILQAGDTRSATENATLMVHYGEWGFVGHTFNFERSAKELARINNLMETHMLARIREKHPKYTAAAFRKRFQFDSYLTAQEAVDLGLLDNVLEAT